MNSTVPQSSQCHVIRDAFPRPSDTVLELRVRNHPGAMSHITGLFARRAFNLEAIICVPLNDGATSRMLLLVSDEPRPDQVERQLGKLHDVLSVRHRADLSAKSFARTAACF
ncbi:MAG TPA: ACT domain-containing protein [Opitutus sp.]|nr:ACT domain-containing protein [Opitutus sp.]